MRPATAAVAACATAATLWAAPSAMADACPNAAVRAQQRAEHLPDCRAFEQVSPAAKGNSDIAVGTLSVWAGRAAADGSALQFESTGAFAGVRGSGHANVYVGRRGADGWATEGLTPRQAPDDFAAAFPVFGFHAFTPDLSTGILMNAADPNDLQSTVAVRRLYRWSAVSGFEPVSPLPTAPASPFWTPYFVGASSDFRHVVSESSVALTPDSPAGAPSYLYAWDDGTVRPIGGPAAADGVSAVANPQPNNNERVGELASLRTVSPDGSQVLFRTGSPQQLWLDERGAAPRQITLSQNEDTAGEPAPHGGIFAGSVSKGGKLETVFFTSADALTDDATVGEDGNGTDLYAYDVASGELTDLVVDHDDPDGARVMPTRYSVNGDAEIPNSLGGTGILLASYDGTRIVFTAAARLTPEVPNSGGSLYLWDRGRISYLAAALGTGDLGAFRMSRDGRRIVLLSPQQLTAEDNGGYAQVYLYDVDSGWQCLSCRRDGRPSTTAARFRASLTGYLFNSSQPHWARILTDDGRRALFETDESLVPQDTNGTSDVYLWQDGAVSLLSSGRGSDGAHLLDASVNGDDVFIATRESLVASDGDRLVDAYDVRVGGGSAEDAAVERSCDGDACQGGATPPPVLAAATSASVRGAGNAPAPRPGPVVGKVSVSKVGTVRGTAAVVRVRAPGGGRIRVTGAGMTPASRTVGRAGVYRVGVRLSRQAQRRARAKRSLAVTLTVRFTPTKGGASTARLRLTFRPRAAKIGRSSALAARQDGLVAAPRKERS